MSDIRYDGLIGSGVESETSARRVRISISEKYTYLEVEPKSHTLFSGRTA